MLNYEERGLGASARSFLWRGEDVEEGEGVGEALAVGGGEVGEVGGHGFFDGAGGFFEGFFAGGGEGEGDFAAVVGGSLAEEEVFFDEVFDEAGGGGEGEGELPGDGGEVAEGAFVDHGEEAELGEGDGAGAVAVGGFADDEGGAGDGFHDLLGESEGGGGGGGRGRGGGGRRRPGRRLPRMGRVTCIVQLLHVIIMTSDPGGGKGF